MRTWCNSVVLKPFQRWKQWSTAYREAIRITVVAISRSWSTSVMFRPAGPLIGIRVKKPFLMAIKRSMTDVLLAVGTMDSLPSANAQVAGHGSKTFDLCDNWGWSRRSPSYSVRYVVDRERKLLCYHGLPYLPASAFGLFKALLAGFRRPPYYLSVFPVCYLVVASWSTLVHLVMDSCLTGARSNTFTYPSSSFKMTQFRPSVCNDCTCAQRPRENAINYAIVWYELSKGAKKRNNVAVFQAVANVRA